MMYCRYREPLKCIISDYTICILCFLAKEGESAGSEAEQLAGRHCPVQGLQRRSHSHSVSVSFNLICMSLLFYIKNKDQTLFIAFYFYIFILKILLCS